jgi:hypothetical protein
MIFQLAEPVLILLRHGRLPKNKEEWLAFGAIGILMVIYYLIKEKRLQGILKWIVASTLFIGGIIGLFLTENGWYKYFLWCLTGAFVYCILFELMRWIIINRRSDYYPPGEEPSNEEMIILTDEEELDVNKIVLVLLVLWLIVGIFVTPSI